jgi:DNA-binding NtrC family response regulator
MLSPQLANETALLFGLDGSLGSELSGALAAQGRGFYFEPVPDGTHGPQVLRRPDVGVVFCLAKRRCYEPVLDSVRHARPELPVVVVSRGADSFEWLNALEAGAADYCSAPFQSGQIGWILEGLRRYAP